MRLPSKAVESFRGLSPAAKSGSAVNFGPYANLAPFAVAANPLAVHFENNAPFAEALSVVREVQVGIVINDFPLPTQWSTDLGKWSRESTISVLKIRFPIGELSNTASAQGNLGVRHSVHPSQF